MSKESQLQDIENGSSYAEDERHFEDTFEVCDCFSFLEAERQADEEARDEW